MRRVLADHNVPAPLVRLLKTFDIRRSDELGLAAVKNGKLLAAAEAAGFDVLLSSDRTIKYEQNMSGRRIGIVSMSDNFADILCQAGFATPALSSTILN